MSPTHLTAPRPIFPFALIPAAGRSRRMGSPKLLLDVNGKTVIARVLTALGEAGLANRLVVLHPQDMLLKTEVETYGGRALLPPTPPPEMRDSIEIGLKCVADEILANGEPADPHQPWFLVPADHPVIDPETVTILLHAAAKNPGQIVVPTHDGRRGHPTVFAWKHALQIDQIPVGLGFNWIVERASADVVEIPFASSGVLVDLDTPEDYERLRKTWK
jgi:molybdenum cofactor cytidylyltransferase